ncbi:hypothetical protein H0A58_11820 [Alcaligenaceae bacterium]|nr:hypothetical protein [Alcaligenaceae bacterium]
MGKVLFWAVLIIGGLLLARVLARHNAASQQPKMPPVAKPAKGLRSKTRADPESMVRCEHCGIHLPRSEAVLSGGRTWCSSEHAKIGRNT